MLHVPNPPQFGLWHHCLHQPSPSPTAATNTAPKELHSSVLHAPRANSRPPQQTQPAAPWPPPSSSLNRNHCIESGLMVEVEMATLGILYWQNKLM